MQIIDYLDLGGRLGREEPCIVERDGESWTYGEAIDLTHRVAAALKRDGFGAGERITVLSPNRGRAFLALMGGMRAQMLWLPVNPKYSIESICLLLSQFSCDFLFIDESFSADVETFRRGVPTLRLIVSLDEQISDDVQAFDAWLAPPDARYDPSPRQQEDLAAILPTGGTTGASKGVEQTNRAFETYVAMHMLAMPHAGRPRFLAATPMTHAAGAMCFPMLARGGTVFVQGGAKPLEVATAFQEFGITDIFLPPTVIYNMLSDPAVRGMTFPDLKYLLYGAAPMSAAKLREALEWLGPVLVQGFGQSEAIALCTVMQPEDHYVGGDVDGEIVGDERLSSCGRPAPLVMMSVMDEHGALLADYERGELVTRSGLVMKGYVGDPEASACASAHGWHHTGDIGYRDADGFYYVVDRIRDMIISGGMNIFPSEIEQVLWSHPGVNDCAVVGAPDEKWGEIVTAVLEAKPGHKLEEQEVMAFCRDRLNSLKIPKSVLIWDQLPRSPVGKVLKREVRDVLWAGSSRRI